MQGQPSQFQAIEEAIRTTNATSVRAFGLRVKNVKPYNLNKYCAILAQEWEFARQLNSQARQAAAERAAFAIKRFYDNCKTEKAKKGYLKFQKNCRSVEYKTMGWKFSGNRKRITFTDGCGIGTLKMVGTRLRIAN